MKSNINKLLASSIICMGLMNASFAERCSDTYQNQPFYLADWTPGGGMTCYYQGNNNSRVWVELRGGYPKPTDNLLWKDTIVKGKGCYRSAEECIFGSPEDSKD